VTVTVLPGQASYQGTSRNGVSSSSFGAWGGSYRFESETPPQPLEITAIRRVGTSVDISFPSKSGAVYDLQRGRTLHDDWNIIEGPIAGTGEVITLRDIGVLSTFPDSYYQIVRRP
jgi:hypothetical protein